MRGIFRLPALVALVTVASGQTAARENDSTSAVAVPSGIYVVNEASNNQPVSTAYAAGLTSSSAYQAAVAGHAIFVPLVKVLPSVATWGEFNWDWTYLDTLVQTAVSHGKKFTLEFEMGFQTTAAYVNSLPAGFASACGVNCAPLFRTWAVGGGIGRCIEGYVPLPWNSNVQQMWASLATAAAAHLKQGGVYGSLTMVHVPGVSIYDEELRLPSGLPRAQSTDTSLCPDGTPAYPNTQNDASQSRWNSLGYSDAAVIGGFGVIAGAFAQAFPDKTIGLSLLNPGAAGVDFPNFNGDPVGFVASQLVKGASTIAAGRVQIQADDLDVDTALPEVLSLAGQFGDTIGWQTNRHGGTGAGCGGSPCAPDASNGPFVELARTGALAGGEYLEVWSADVVAYPESFACIRAAGLYTRDDSDAGKVPSNGGNCGRVPRALPVRAPHP